MLSWRLCRLVHVALLPRTAGTETVAKLLRTERHSHRYPPCIRACVPSQPSAPGDGDRSDAPRPNPFVRSGAVLRVLRQCRGAPGRGVVGGVEIRAASGWIEPCAESNGF